MWIMSLSCSLPGAPIIESAQSADLLVGRLVNGHRAAMGDPPGDAGADPANSSKFHVKQDGREKFVNLRSAANLLPISSA